MALVLLSRQDDYNLVHTDQDCRGWTVKDTAGNQLGKVTDMVIDTDAEHVDSIILEGGNQIPAADIALRDRVVVVRGAHTASDLTATATTDAANVTANKMAAGALSTAHAADAASATANVENEIALPVIEERIMIGKREIERGGVRVRTHVTEQPVEETVTLQEERVHVERRAADNRVAADGVEAFKEGVIEITEQAEEAVVAKQARVVEEVVVGKEVTERQETVRDTVRRTDVEVEEITPTDARRR